MNIKTLGWTALALCCIGFAGAMVRLASTQSAQAPEAGVQAPAAAKSETVTVLGYGAIGTGAEALAPEEFRRQMEYLRSAGFTPVSLQDFQEWRAGSKKLPPKAVLLTFEQADDGFVASALPVLSECGHPFLVFVDTHLLGSRKGYISERELGMIIRGGGSVGACSSSPESATAWQEAELRGADDLGTLAESELGAPARRLSTLCNRECTAFSHFADATDPTLMRELVRAGYAIAFSRTGGAAKKDTPAFNIPRYMLQGPADFYQALGAPAPKPAQPAAQPAPSQETAPATPTDVEFEDDCVAIDDDDPDTAHTTGGQPATQPEQTTEEATAGDAETPEEEVEPPLEQIPDTPVAPTYAKLGKRTPDGHWVTSSFRQPLVPREKTRVAVLGYHNFSNTKTVSEMRMRTHVFCQQMQYIHEAGLAVISMQDFIEWRFGTRLLPERCVLITIDDGWKSVYTDAYPVLKAYGYPFTLFLYTRYIDVKGDSMTSGQIREMQANGATIGSHSTNHLYPRSWKRYNNKPEEYAAQIQKEILDSGTKLTSMFGPCTAYCYPGGYNTQQMIDALKGSPFRVAFTVLEQKVGCKEPPYQIHRYMVFGTDHRIFRRAVNFDGEAGVKPTKEGIDAAEATARVFFPKAFEGIPLPEAPAEEPQAADDEVAIDPDDEDASTGNQETAAAGPTPATEPAAEPAAEPAEAPAEEAATPKKTKPAKKSKRKGGKKK